jgi:hypothetical protein
VFCAEKDSGFFAALRVTQRTTLRHPVPVTQSSPKGVFSLVSPFGGDVVGKKTVFTQGVEELEIESHD